MLIALSIITQCLLCLTAGKLSAQSISRDSLKRAAFSRDSLIQDSIADVARTINLAKMDGRRLRLSARQKKLFNADKQNSSSDLFKPRPGLVSDTALLKDSVYVKAFRMAGYRKAFGDGIIIPRSYWGSLGIGTGSLGSFTFSVNANQEFSYRLLITACAQAETNAFFGSTTIASYGVLAGEVFKQKFSLFTVSAGLSIVNVGTSSGFFNSVPVTSQTTIGIPILIQGYLVGLQTVGLGLNAYANLNSIRSTLGLTLNLALGRMATHKKSLKL